MKESLRIYLDMLNEHQLRAVLHFGNPLLVLAGAGSGKTRVITTKIAYLIEELGIEPYSILAVTFTNKAAEEMRERVVNMVGNDVEPMVKTFHSFGAWFLRRNSHLVGLESGFNIYDESDSLRLLKDIFGKRYSTEELKRYLHIIGQLKSFCVAPDGDYSPVTYDPEVGIVYSAYQKRLQEIGNVDFGDLIMRPVKLLNENKEVKRRTRQRFKVILVDEYQDSNHAQFELLKALYGGDNYLCVVGDEDQSIYGFRGADINNILSFPDCFPDTDVIRLERNYRSTREILDVASSVVQNNKNRLGKRLWTEKTSGRPVELVVLNDEREEAAFCAELLSDGNYGGTAIMYRMNSQSRVFEEYFSNLGIPYRVIGTKRFYEREEVKDVVAYLAFVLNPRDKISFMRIVNKPPRGIGKTSLERILPYFNYSTLLKAVEGDLSGLVEGFKGKRSVAIKGLESFFSLVAEVRDSLVDNPLSQSIKKLIRKSGLYDYYREKDAVNGTMKSDNLEELVNAASSYSNGPDELSRFLENITLDSSEEDPYESDNAVNLITLHNTKGLEFDRVIITGLEQGIIPHRSNSEEEEDIEEERRLFYVGITRAKETLVFTTCRVRRIFGTTEPREPSQFLGEIPKGLLRIVDRSYGTYDGETSTSDEDYPVGCVVYHYDYGTGIIVKNWYNNGMLNVIVRFESGKTARFIPKYTDLERVSQYD